MIRVGITGHQRLDDPTAWNWVESEICRELDTLPTPLVAVSSLAIGADQLFAALVTGRDGKLHAVIPFEEYERAFSLHDVEAYHQILSKADTVEVLQNSGADEKAYLASGKRVVELSDILIAVWDGQQAKGEGGTADIATYAIDAGLPLVHINPVDRTVTRSQAQKEYYAFFASRMNREQSELNDLRMDIHRLGVKLDRPVWVAEMAAQDLYDRTNEEIQIACMRHVREVPAFICIIDGSYGKPWNAAQICVLELEIMAATLAGKPFHFFLLAPYQEDARTESLLRVVSLMRPELTNVKPQSADDILKSLKDALSKEKQSYRDTAQQGVSRTEADLNVQFLNEVFVPLNPGEPEEKNIHDLLLELHSKVTQDTTDQATRLVYLWMAIRHLCAAPYNDPNYTQFLPYWDQALSLWASAASWYGLHGINFLGRLAAVNTVLRIRQRLVPSDNLSIQGSKGALASEYYSIAKTLRSRTLKRRLLNRALAVVNRSLEEPHVDPSGLLAIRGSVLQALGRLQEGLRDYHAMLSIRQSACEDSGKIGEAEAELGWGYFRLWSCCRFFMLGHLFRAQHFLAHGVELLKVSERDEFSVRAMRKLGFFYALTFRLSRARRVMEQAHDLAQEKAMQDQIRQIMPMLRVLRRVTRMPKTRDKKRR